MADITLIFEEQPISLALTTATPINLVLDGGATYTAGTGISIAGAVITNTAPAVANDALGTGFTSGGGTGTIPAAAATLSGHFGIENNGNNIDFGDLDNSVYGLKLHIDDIEMRFGNNQFYYNLSPEGEYQLFASPSSQIEQSITYTTVNLLDGNFSFSDQRATTKGIEYTADYSATIAANPRSIPDVGTVDLLKQTPVSYTNAAAPNNCIFYSTTLSKLAYKDPGGTVNPLY